MRAVFRRVVASLAAVAGVLLVAVGAALAGAPARVGGPFNLDLAMPLGLLCLGAGVLTLESAADAAAYFAAALVAGAAAAARFYASPPFDDGAYFLLRYGPDAADWRPAPPYAHVAAFAVAAWALLRGLQGGVPGPERLGSIAVLAVGTALCSAAYSVFLQYLIGQPAMVALALSAFGGLAIAGAVAVRTARRAAVQLAGGLVMVTALLSAASWVLFDLFV